MYSQFLDSIKNTNQIIMAINNMLLILSITIIVLSIFFVFIYFKDLKQAMRIYNVPKDIPKHNNYFTDVLFKKLSKNLLILEQDKGKKEGWSKKITMLLILINIGLGIFMLVNKQILLALIMPIIILIVITKMTELLALSVSEKIQVALPYAIDSVIRAMSKSDDLKTVLYDASQVIDDPLKDMFAQMSIRMMQKSPSLVLNDFMNEQRNIWIYAFSFTLENYIEDASKEDTVKQLRKLKDVLDKENKEKNANKAEKKMTTAINYTLCIFAFIALIANIMFNPIGKSFFFSSALGILSFLVGITLVIVSIFSNLLISNGRV